MNFFSESYFRNYAAATRGLRRFVRDRLGLAPKVPWLFRRIKNLSAGARVLDVGCGRGGFLQLMERENPAIDSYGLDIGTPAERLSNGLFVRGSATALPFADNTFDVVTCTHVIEHIQDALSCVQELVRVCRPGGVIYIEAPSPRAASVPIFNNFWDDPTHIRPYSRQSLGRMFELVGADVLRTGVKHSIPAVLFGLPYLPIGLLMGDRQAPQLFAAYAFGFSVWAVGRKAVPE